MIQNVSVPSREPKICLTYVRMCGGQWRMCVLLRCFERETSVFCLSFNPLRLLLFRCQIASVSICLLQMSHPSITHHHFHIKMFSSSRSLGALLPSFSVLPLILHITAVPDAEPTFGSFLFLTKSLSFLEPRSWSAFYTQTSSFWLNIEEWNHVLSRPSFILFDLSVIPLFTQLWQAGARGALLWLTSLCVWASERARERECKRERVREHNTYI